jgi:thioredoxin 1
VRNLVRSVLMLLACFAGTAFAAPTPFSQAAFDQLQKQGKPTLVMIQADWCPTCRAQAPIIDGLLKTPEFKPIHALRVDFDAQKSAVREFKASMQSTLIVFKDGKEVGRSIGDTRKDGIAALLNKAL